jgi:hypothetical protein
MLELAILFVVISAVVRPLGAAYANVADATLSIAGLIAVVWLIAGAVAFALSRPMDRRLLHHA